MRKLLGTILITAVVAWAQINKANTAAADEIVTKLMAYDTCVGQKFRGHLHTDWNRFEPSLDIVKVETACGVDPLNTGLYGDFHAYITPIISAAKSEAIRQLAAAEWARQVYKVLEK